MNLLVAEDEALIREGICEFLQEEGYQVFEACDGEEALNIFRTKDIHLMLLDIMMPKMDGMQVLREVRKISDIPVLMLTALTDEGTQVESFDSRADDYVSKPFSLLVLKKRVEALLRRKYPQNTIWQYNGAAVDFQGFTAAYQGNSVKITPKEVQLLEVLVRNAGRAVTREQMLDAIWNEEEAPFDRVIDVYIKNLRKKLHLSCIVTVKGIGYKIEL